MYVQHSVAKKSESNAGTADLHKAASNIADNCFAFRARRLNRLISRIYDEALRPLGIKSAQLNLIVGIALRGAVKQAELGRLFDIEKSTLSRNLARMVKSGWVRSIDRGDGRGQELSLTQAGKAVLLEALPVWQQAQAAGFAASWVQTGSTLWTACPKRCGRGSHGVE